MLINFDTTSCGKQVVKKKKKKNDKSAKDSE